MVWMNRPATLPRCFCGVKLPCGNFPDGLVIKRSAAVERQPVEVLSRTSILTARDPHSPNHHYHSQSGNRMFQLWPAEKDYSVALPDCVLNHSRTNNRFPK